MFTHYIPSNKCKNEVISDRPPLYSSVSTYSHPPSNETSYLHSLNSQNHSAYCENLSASLSTSPSDTDCITEDSIVSHSSPRSQSHSSSHSHQIRSTLLQADTAASGMPLLHEACSPSLSSGYESISDQSIIQGPQSHNSTFPKSTQKNNCWSSHNQIIMPRTNSDMRPSIFYEQKTPQPQPQQCTKKNIFPIGQRSHSPPPPPPAYHSSHNAIFRNKTQLQSGTSQSSNNPNSTVLSSQKRTEDIPLQQSLYNGSAELNEVSYRSTKPLPHNPAIFSPQQNSISQPPLIRPASSSSIQGVVNNEDRFTSYLYKDLEKQLERNCEITKRITQTLHNAKQSEETAQYLKEDAALKENNQFISQSNSSLLQKSVCTACHQRIFNASDACQAMGKVYHNNCFICCCCKRSLRGKVFYKDQGKVYCEDDYLYCGFQRRAEKCSSCGHIITDMILQAVGKSYHPGCFRCCVCNECLDGLPFTVDGENRVYCVQDYHRVYAPRCESCGLAIIPVEGSDEIIRVVAMDRNFHIECFHCEDCQLQLTDEQESRCYPLTEPSGKIHLLCKACHLTRREASSTNSSNHLIGDYSAGGKSSPIHRAPQAPPPYSTATSGMMSHRVMNESSSSNASVISSSHTSSTPPHRTTTPSSRPHSNVSINENTFSSSAGSSSLTTRTSSTVVIPSSSSTSVPSVGIKYSPLLRRSIPGGNGTSTAEFTSSSNTTASASLHINSSSNRLPRT